MCTLLNLHEHRDIVQWSPCMLYACTFPDEWPQRMNVCLWPHVLNPRNGVSMWFIRQCNQPKWTCKYPITCHKHIPVVFAEYKWKHYFQCSHVGRQNNAGYFVLHVLRRYLCLSIEPNIGYIANQAAYAGAFLETCWVHSFVWRNPTVESNFGFVAFHLWSKWNQYSCLYSHCRWNWN